MKNIFIVVILIGLGSITSAQTLPNAEFQSWVDYGIYEEPEFWSTPNPFTALPPIFVITVSKSHDAFSGDYSVKLETKDVLGGTYQAPGLITLAQFSIDFINLSFNISGGLALQENVSKLTGMYKYQGAEGDSASVLIYNFKRDEEGVIDTIGYGLSYLHDTAIWTPFTVNMENLNNNIPDTFNVIIMSSAMTPNFEFHSGSVLYVDSLAIETNTGVINLSDYQIKVKVFPNPSSDFVQFETSESENKRLISIYNAVGSIISTNNFFESKTNISVNELPSGPYFYRVTRNNRLLNRGSFIKN
ncbi:MAG: T9SS type A sorting domain-containing protein [Bacteroidetes bacterium]|nr:T9SS type A sorting domain-containing protein [Bacteroidota bacterium]MBL6944922.1 T9SS type A sorting domain-containing protein [Bacteroidales bacterium]